MADLKLEPGWLSRDVVRAAQRTTDWKLQKEQAVERETHSEVERQDIKTQRNKEQ
jgi:hypothetical protein